MAITTQQKEERGRWIGSSDVAALLGLSPWRNVYDVWLEKTNRLEPQPPAEGAMEDGIIFEPGILTWAEKRLGPLEKNPKNLWFKDEAIRIISHPDAIVVATGEPVEAKTSGLRGPLPPGWGEPETDQIPDYYLVQAQVHVMLSKKDLCHVPAYLGGRGPTMFRVNRNESLQQFIGERVGEFWAEYVKKDIPPPDVVPHLETAKRMIRQVGKLVAVDPRIVERARAARLAKSITEKTSEEADAALIAALGDAEGTEDGSVSYFRQERKGLDLKQLKVNHPELWQQFPQDSIYRVLRFKKEKSNG